MNVLSTHSIRSITFGRFLAQGVSASRSFAFTSHQLKDPKEKHKSTDNYENAKEKGKDTFEVGKSSDKTGKVKNDAAHQKADKKLKESKAKTGKKDKENLQGAGK